MSDKSEDEDVQKRDYGRRNEGRSKCCERRRAAGLLGNHISIVDQKSLGAYAGTYRLGAIASGDENRLEIHINGQLGRDEKVSVKAHDRRKVERSIIGKAQEIDEHGELCTSLFVLPSVVETRRGVLQACQERIRMT
jgi:hypothetical protein